MPYINLRELIQEVECLKAENEMLKSKASKLEKLVTEQQNWKGIREGEIVPRLRARYGHGNCVFTNMASDISKIVKELVDVEKITEINETNYEEARQVAIALTETICKFDWKHLKRLQIEEWSKWDKRPKL